MEKTKECTDENCPIHGSLSTRKNTSRVVVVSAKMDNSAVVEKKYHRKIPKFKRFERKVTRLSVHKPGCMDVKEGDEVIIAPCRPVSKTKSHVIIGKVESELRESGASKERQPTAAAPTNEDKKEK